VPRKPKPLTRERLQNYAMFYLERWSAPRAHLRRTLIRKVDKNLLFFDGDRDEMLGWVDELVERIAAAGLVNDRAWALARARTLRRRGGSRMQVVSKLRAKGVSMDDINYALNELLSEDDSEQLAALRLAKRRRLGPWRRLDRREERRDKDLAAMMRAGYSYGLAREVIDADLAESEETIALARVW